MSSPSLSPEEKKQSESETHTENASEPVSLRKEIQELDESRMQKINELTAAMEYLNSTPVGLSAPLVDSDGFPRDDLDLYAISAARHTVACVQNDLKAIDEALYKKLNALHEETREIAKKQMASSKQDNNNETNAVKLQNESKLNTFQTDNVQSEVLNNNVVDTIHENTKPANARTLAEIEKLKPFLRVAHVDVNSPASEGNLHADDLILQVRVVDTTETNSDSADKDNNNNTQDNNNIIHNNSAEVINVIDASNFTQFGQFVALHESKMLSFWVRRLVDEDNINRGERTEVIELFIVPQRWVGAGLLGCAFDVVNEIE